jgi:hypothetical protein
MKSFGAILVDAERPRDAVVEDVLEAAGST